MRVMVSLVIAVALIASSASAQRQIGIDIPAYGSYSVNSVPAAFVTTESGGGFGYDLGAGIFFQPSSTLKFKAGFHVWNKIFEPKQTGNFTLDEVEFSGRVEEQGVIKYSGLYLLASYEQEKFFAGGGLDISFSKGYKATLTIFDESGNVIASGTDLEQSFFTDEFTNQIDFLLHIGYILPLGNRLSFRPQAQVALPLEPLFSTGVRVYNPYTRLREEAEFNVALIKIGMTVEFAVSSR